MKHRYQTVPTAPRRWAMLPLLLALLGLALPHNLSAQVWINELHYDNDGADTGEFIEVAGVAGTDLAGWSLVLYNGANSESYDTVNLTGTLADDGSGFGFAAFFIAGIQNGSPDGLALVDPSSNVVQFLSYEGSFTASDGPANGMTTTDIGVSEGSSTDEGESLQLIGTGSEYEDFSWSGPADDSPGSVNAGQTLVAPPPSGDNDRMLVKTGPANPTAICEFVLPGSTPLARYNFDEDEWDLGQATTGFSGDEESGTWTSADSVNVFVIKQGTKLYIWDFASPVTSASYNNPENDASNFTWCGPPPSTCEATTVLDEFVQENGQTYLKLTFTNAKGIEEIDFTLFDNLMVHQVMPTPDTQNLGDAGGPVMTFTGGPTSVMIYLTRQDDTNPTTQYMGTVVSTGQTGQGEPCVTEFDPVRTFPASTPKAFELSAAYPNPFNPQTTIRFALPEAASATLAVYDVMGRRVATLATGPLQAGVHTVTWNGTDAQGQPVASGVYLYRLEAGAFTETRSMLLLK